MDHDELAKRGLELLTYWPASTLLVRLASNGLQRSAVPRFRTVTNAET